MEKFICQYCQREFDKNFAHTFHEKHCNKNPNKIKLPIKNTTCPICNKEIRVNNIQSHLRRHEANPGKDLSDTSVYKVDHDGLECKFCNKLCKNLNSLTQHEIRCNKNPNRIELSNGFDAWNHNGHTAWNKGLTKETDSRIQQQIISRKKYLETHPEQKFGGFRNNTAKRCKYGTYDGVYFDSSWELAVYLYYKDIGSTIVRNTSYFEYTFNDKTCRFYPDFIIDGKYCEVKGVYREEDYEKIKQFPQELIVINSDNIRPYVKYAENKYGVNFTEILYDKTKPSYLDNSGKENYKLNNL